jgi:hypothetical protein
MAQDKARNGEMIGTRYKNGTVEKDHRGNGDPRRPSVLARLEKRAETRKREAKNAKARERRAAAKAAK